MIKLVPILFYLRRDRREWVRREGRNIDKKKYTKHAEKALATFIALGPSYIKLGQWLSTRTDVLPQPYLEVLAKLQDDVPPSDFSMIQGVIESEIGSIEQVFDSFEKQQNLEQVWANPSGSLWGSRRGRKGISSKYRDDRLKRYPGAKVYTPIGNPLHRSKSKVLCRGNVFAICRNYW